MTHALQFTEQDWERIDRDWTAWWVGDLDPPLVMIENPIFSRLPEELSELFSIIQKTGRGTTPWAPGRCYMLQSDFSAMISPQMFESFVLPDLAACCKKLDFTFYHLDGEGQINHLDHLLSLEKLHGVQWIPGEGQPSPASWLPLFQRFIDAGKLCQLYVNAEDTQTIVRELGGGGFAFYITEDLNTDESKCLIRLLNSNIGRH